MTVFYVRHEEYDDKAKVIHGLAAIYGLRTYRITAVVIDDEQHLERLGPLLESLAEHVETPTPSPSLKGWELAESVQVSGTPQYETLGTLSIDVIRSANQVPTHDAPLVEKKRKRGEVPKGICPECGKMAPMTKKGYCKVCAMRKAREAKKTPHPTLSPEGERNIEKSAVPVVRENPPGAPEIVFETTPMEIRQLHRHGAIKGKRLG